MRRSTAKGGPRSCWSPTARPTRMPVRWVSTSCRAPGSTRASRTSRRCGCEPATSRACSFTARGAPASAAGRRCPGTTSTASSCVATLPFPCRSTARTPGTSSKPCTRPSGTPSRCSSSSGRCRPRRRLSAAMSRVLDVEGDLRRVIGDGAGSPDREVDGLGSDDLLALYRNLVLLRTYDERSVVYHRQGRIGTYAIFWNHEAMQAGSVFALEARDWIFPSYRDSAIGLLRGMPVSTVLSWWRGHPAGWWNPADYNVASICVPIGTQIPHAVGFAWGSKLKGEDRVTIVNFGDGATSEGSFHEGATFAGVVKAPVILFCNNNQWAISTPVSHQTAASAIADKAIGYGIPGVRVDGLDILAVYEATREAVARARAGEGPTFIEAVSYRAAPHATADDPKAYIDLERVEEAKRDECVARYDAYLRRLGVLDDQTATEIKAWAAELMREAIAAAEAE